MIDTQCPHCQEKDAEIVRLKLEIERRDEFMLKIANYLDLIDERLDMLEKNNQEVHEIVSQGEK